MTIDIKEKGSEAFYKEVVNIMYNFRKLLKAHSRKLSDYFKQYRILAIISAVLFVAIVAMSIAWGWDMLSIVAVALMAICAVFCVLMLSSFNKVKSNMMANGGNTVLTFDDEAVTFSKAGGTTVKLNWNTVAFVRLFSECLAIIPNEATAIIISMDKAYAPQVLDWLSENKPQIEVIR